MVLLMLIILRVLSSDFFGSRWDRKLLNTDSESALKTTLKNGVKCVYDNRPLYDKKTPTNST